MVQRRSDARVVEGAAPRASHRLSVSRREALWGYVFILPWIIGFLAFSAYPIGSVFYLSFTEYNVLQPAEWVGFDNYVKIFTNDKLFWKSLYNTVYFVALSVPGQLILGLAAALLVNQKVRGQAFWRTAFYLPVMVPYVVSSILFVWILDARLGVMNYTLDLVGIDGPAWFQSETWAKPAIVLLTLWHMGSYMVIFLAGLQAIPDHLYEAASLDGAGTWRKLINITLPMLTPALLFNLVVGIINSFQVFTFAYVMTRGGPLNSTTFYVYYLYRRAFEYFDMGYAAALSVILFVIVMALTAIIFKWSNRWVYYEGSTTGGGI